MGAHGLSHSTLSCKAWHGAAHAQHQQQSTCGSCMLKGDSLTVPCARDAQGAQHFLMPSCFGGAVFCEVGPVVLEEMHPISNAVTPAWLEGSCAAWNKLRPVRQEHDWEHKKDTKSDAWMYQD